MSAAPRARSFAPEEWRTYRDLRLAALADSPDAFGSTLARENGHEDERWSSRLAAAVASDLDLPLVAEVGPEPGGLAWARIDPAELEVVHLFQMWVSPESRGLGAGSTLLASVVAWLRSLNAASLGLRVTCDNTPARRFYERAGFLTRGQPEPLRPGSSVLVQPMHLDIGEPGA